MVRFLFCPGFGEDNDYFYENEAENAIFMMSFRRFVRTSFGQI